MSADLIVTNARIYTQDEAQPWAEAVAVADGLILAVGTREEVSAHEGDATQVHDLDGAFVLPGLVDGHLHLHLGGSQAAYELPLLPTDGLDEILGKVAAWAERLGPDEWVVGGIVGSTVMDTIVDATAIARLDEAAGGRPVLLRDDSMHNRWVNTAALAQMGVDADAPDPEGGHYARDGEGRLTGVLQELASAVAEGAFVRSVPDPSGRIRGGIVEAVRILNSFGITSAQDAATMAPAVAAMAALADDGELNARVVVSTPSRPFIEDGIVGEELLEAVAPLRREQVLPEFVKVVLDGVPMTRTTALLQPYVCHHEHDPEETGEVYWELDDLVVELERCYERGLGAKIHATGDASVRRALDAIELVRERHGDGPVFQIAHTEYVDPVDVPRFAALGVVADLSPYIWYPNVIQESIAAQVPADLVERSWPTRALADSGALLSAGSDWPCAAPSPDPWTGLQTLVTRRNPAAPDGPALNGAQAITLTEAIAAFTVNPAQAAGLGAVAGRVAVGYSADLAVLDRDLFAVGVNDIHRTQVLRTYYRGQVVHGEA